MLRGVRGPLSSALRSGGRSLATEIGTRLAEAFRISTIRSTAWLTA